MNPDPLTKMRSRLRVALLLALGIAGLAISGQPLDAQVIPPGMDLRQLAETMSPDEIIRRLEASGLSRAQVRDRLRRAGYDPSLADRYFDAMESGASLEASSEDAGLLTALRGIGVQLRDPQTDTLNRILPPMDSLQYPLYPMMEMEPDTAPQVFGADVFDRYSTEFEPLLTGPVGPSYVVGPGDELLLILTGDVELAYTVDVTREGDIVIPQVGQLAVNGLTLEAVERRLMQRMGQVYSTLRDAPDASTRLDVSLGRLRTNQVRVAGAVERPGSYQVSSVATLLEALYLAGGPTENGSYRRIVLQRAGEGARELDLYPYLTTGAISEDPRLQEGDVVFVPPVGDQVTVRGLVRRAAIFEIRPGEGLPALVRFAGGLLPDADVNRAQVERVLPPADRTEGQDRVVLDAPLGAVLSGAQEFPLRAGDQLQVFAVSEELRQYVRVDGAVWRPGAYQLRPGTTVASLVERAGGLREEAFTPEVLVRRVDPATGRQTALRADFGAGETGPLLQEFDEVVVFAQDSLLVPDSVAIYGEVKNPGRYPLAAGLTAGDLVLLAGGFTKGAAPWSAEVVRPARSGVDERQLSISRTVALRGDLPYSNGDFLEERPDSVDGLPPEESIVLGDGDEVFIRRLASFVEPERVTVQGEVLRPGPYQLNRRDERFTSIMERVGGLTAGAFAEGTRLIRDGVPVGLDYERAMANPGSPDDPVLTDGDRIVVPVVDNTVLITGAVVFEARAVYRGGMTLGDVIEQAGGYAENADKGRVSVEYANGTRATPSKILWLFSSNPDIRPGSTIFVPEKEVSEGGFDWDSALSRVLAVASTLATVFIATR